MIKKLNHTVKASSLAIMLAAVLLSPASQAQVVTLQDGNSSALVNVNSDAGMSQWLVNGVNNLNQQWFWFGVGQGGPQAPINSISSAAYTQSAANTLDTTYANTSFSVEINYTLTGGGTGSADIAEGITIHNSTSSALNFHFFQYSDFNLLNTAGGDTVIMNASQAYQYKGSSGIAEGIVSPTANEFEANTTGGTGSTLYKLNNVNGLVLNNNSSAGPGDVTWAYEWDLSIPANTDAIITKDKDLNIELVPEPATFTLVVLAFIVLLFCRSLGFWKQIRSS
jgi:hypothetical protein